MTTELLDELSNPDAITCTLDAGPQVLAVEHRTHGMQRADRPDTVDLVVTYRLPLPALQDDADKRRQELAGSALAAVQHSPELQEVQQAHVLLLAEQGKLEGLRNQSKQLETDLEGFDGSGPVPLEDMLRDQKTLMTQISDLEGYLPRLRLRLNEKLKAWREVARKALVDVNYEMRKQLGTYLVPPPPLPEGMSAWLEEVSTRQLMPGLREITPEEIHNQVAAGIPYQDMVCGPLPQPKPEPPRPLQSHYTPYVAGARMPEHYTVRTEPGPDQRVQSEPALPSPQPAGPGGWVFHPDTAGQAREPEGKILEGKCVFKEIAPGTNPPLPAGTLAPERFK